jgi:alpha-mannosidase
VQYILDSVISELENNPSRRFIYAEMAFFARWFYEQSGTRQESVRRLVKSGQLEFINGGWCMHDEAAAHYIAMIDQTTLGHQFLAKEFGFTPRVGWQIDPFGHSSTQASLLSWAAGFDALYFGRIDYQDREIRKETQECEGLWRASPSLGADAQVFWGLTGSYDGNYQPPTGFHFDVTENSAVPVMDDLLLHGYNVDQRVGDFVEQAVLQGGMTKGRHIMMTMGSDFQYEAAQEWFKNLDKIIHYTNLLAGDQVNVFYSTPSAYTDAKHAEGIAWTVKSDDFFPYSDSEHAYWTGYFTSRPLLKRFERVTSAHLQAARQIELLSRQVSSGGEDSASIPPPPKPRFCSTASHVERCSHDQAFLLSLLSRFTRAPVDFAVSMLPPPPTELMAFVGVFGVAFFGVFGVCPLEGTGGGRGIRAEHP